VVEHDRIDERPFRPRRAPIDATLAGNAAETRSHSPRSAD
jgi:hypothetical protein